MPLPGQISVEINRYGLPVAIRMDNGAPFGRRDGLAGLTQFSVWLLTLDVLPGQTVQAALRFSLIHSSHRACTHARKPVRRELGLHSIRYLGCE